MVSTPAFRSEMKRARSGGNRQNASAPSNQPPNQSTGLINGRGQSHRSHQTTFFAYDNRAVAWMVLSCRPVIKILKSSYIHPLLLVLPFALLSNLLYWPVMVQFILTSVSMIPLSSLNVFILDDLSMHLGQTAGGLVNAAFGNVVEIVFGIVALRHNEIRLLQASLLGLIFSNTLFGPSCCFIVGGVSVRLDREQDFGSPVTLTMSFIMLVATVSIVVPTTIEFIATNIGQKTHDMAALSHGSAIVMLLIYFAYLTFQLKTHADMFDVENTEDYEEELEEEASLNIYTALAVLAIVTTLVALCAQSLINNIGAIVEQTHSSRTFIGFIIIPFLSNTADNITAIQVAFRDNMELAIGVAIGSSLQIILFVTPLLVVLGWIMGVHLTLSFGILEAAVLLLSSFVIVLILQNGRSNYLDGVLCMGLYIIIAMTFFVFADDGMI